MTTSNQSSASEPVNLDSEPCRTIAAALDTLRGRPPASLRAIALALASDPARPGTLLGLTALARLRSGRPLDAELHDALLAAWRSRDIRP